jgi:hypothetical protein
VRSVCLFFEMCTSDSITYQTMASNSKAALAANFEAFQQWRASQAVPSPTQTQGPTAAPSSVHISVPVPSPITSVPRVRENKAEATKRSEVAEALGCGAQVDRGMGFHPPHLFRFSALQDLG